MRVEKIQNSPLTAITNPQSTNRRAEFKATSCPGRTELPLKSYY